MTGLTPIEEHLRIGEQLESTGQLVVRGWPLTVDGLLHNADATHRRYSRGGGPFLAISAEVTVLGWDLDVILAGPRLRTRHGSGRGSRRGRVRTGTNFRCASLQRGAVRVQ